MGNGINCLIYYCALDILYKVCGLRDSELNFYLIIWGFAYKGRIYQTEYRIQIAGDSINWNSPAVVTSGLSDLQETPLQQANQKCWKFSTL